MGRLGIEVMGYNFSYANVWGRVHGPYARGGARTPAYLEAQAPAQTPIPKGTVWSVQYDPSAPEGDIGTVSEEVLWERYTRFLHDMIPVAEEANVRLAMHPADPRSASFEEHIVSCGSRSNTRSSLTSIRAITTAPSSAKARLPK